MRGKLGNRAQSRLRLYLSFVCLFMFRFCSLFSFYVLRKELGPTVSKNRLGEIESDHPIVPFMLFLSLLRARTSIFIRICISSTTRSAAKQRRMKTTKTNSSSIICISTSQILINARVSVCAIASSLTQTHSRNRCNRALRSSISFFGVFSRHCFRLSRWTSSAHVFIS